MKGERLGEFEELVLLSACQLGDNAYGLTIQDTLAAEAGRAASVGAVYAALGRLEQKGYYRVTNAGLQALLDLRAVRDGFWQRLDALGLTGGLSS